MRNVAAYHTLPAEVGRVAREAGARLLVLNHFVPTRFDRAALVAEVRETWRGPLVVGEDLMSYDCETRVLSHREARLSFSLD
jgi:ribonuclease Z